MTDTHNGEELDITREFAQEAGDDFFIVGLGASAGGIKALKEFFAHAPATSGMAYVVILHLSPDHDSKLAEVLQTTAAMPVTQVAGRVRVVPDHVYVITPNRSLSLEDGHLMVSDVMGFEERRAPVDIFFRTLAESCRERAACVVLSGTGPDGSMGLKRVKERGGIALAQEPGEAEYEDMPRNAIATGLVDYVLPVAELPARIIAYQQHHRETTARPAAPVETESFDEQSLRDIFTLLRMHTGHDFANYKRATILRRIERRVSIHGLSGLAAYSRFMREQKDEARALLKDLLISVTHFFRDRAAFQALEHSVIPKLFEGKGPAEHVRVWVAGCATGEEAYSIAMLLAEHVSRLAEAPRAQVFASDIDEQAIIAARDGYYTNSDVADVSPERLRQFFLKEEEGYRVRRELREMILFAHHNLIKDPPFSHLDLVTCRNLLIYLNRAAQGRVMEVFHFALNPGGYLFLGLSETVDGASDLFFSLDKDAHIFQGRAVPSRMPFPLPDQSPTSRVGRLSAESRARDLPARERLSYAELHHQIIERYGPPSILVNEEHDIVHLSEHAGRYLRHAGGAPSHNLLKAVRPELRVDLSAALYQAKRRQTNVEARGLSVNVDGRAETINLIVRPVLREGAAGRGFILVLFEEAQTNGGEAGAGANALEAVEATGPAARQFEEELLAVRAQLRSTVEQFETQVEESQASNEELQAMNEELRSTAEELETSKEELQSINEELTTVNQELKNKIEELSHASNDFRNLMNSTQIGTIFLDRSLRVKLFTPPMRSLFNLIPADLGRALTDINSQLDYEGLTADIEHVLEKLCTVEREVRTRGGEWRQMRIIPYRTEEDQIKGVVMTFMDITGRIEALAEREQLLARIKAEYDQKTDILESIGDVFYSVDENYRIIYVNRKAEELWGRGREQLIGQHFWTEFPAEVGGEFYLMHLKAVEERQPVHLETFSPLLKSWIAASIFPLRSGGLSVYFRDIGERRRGEEALRDSEGRLRIAIDAAAMATWDWNLLTNESRWNEQHFRLIGMQPREGMVKADDFFERVHPEDRAWLRERLNHAIAENITFAGEFRVTPEDGVVRWMSGYGRLVMDASGRPARMSGVMFDVTERKEAEEALRRAYDELEQRTVELMQTNADLESEVGERQRTEQARIRLLRLLVFSQEDERRRIARDMHDQFGQQLTALLLKLSLIKAKWGERTGLREQIEALEAVARQLDRDVDFLVWELRPTLLDDLGLQAALTHYGQNWSKHFDIPLETHVMGLERERLPSEVETVLYRIAQEALTNIAKHAQATRAALILERQTQQVMLIIEDNGVGFDMGQVSGASHQGLGLEGMRERAALVGGTVEIESQPSAGTTIYVRIPGADKGDGG